MGSAISYFILVPMVYLAALVFVVGVAFKAIALLRAPRHSAPLRVYPRPKAPALAALSDTFLMPQIRSQNPVFWFFLVIYHVGFVLLILGHLDLFPGITIMPEESVHMVGNGFAGVAVTLSVLYFLLRRMRGGVKDISVFGDYLLLLLLLFLFLTGDTISWANSWNEDGFVLGKVEFADYLQILTKFSFESPRDALDGSHYIVVVLHVLLANLFLMTFPFSKVMHTFFAMPLNRLRRGF